MRIFFFNMIEGGESMAKPGSGKRKMTAARNKQYKRGKKLGDKMLKGFLKSYLSNSLHN